MLCHTREHAGANLLAVVEREHVVGVPGARKCAMRARLPLNLPPDAKQRLQENAGANRRPVTHAAAGSTKLMATGLASPCSMRSARTRKANTSALDIASADVEP